MITDQQRKERINYLGSSDAAGVLGLSPWSSPVKVWAEKSGALVPEDISDKFQIRHGNKMEPVIAEMYMEETGEKAHRVNETLYHPKYKFIAANLDYRIVGKRKGLECKATSSYRGKEWEGDEMPAEVIIQCLHQMAVTGYTEWDAAVLIGNHALKIKTIQRDDAAIKRLIQAEVDFWEQFVLLRVMPDKFTSRDQETLERLYPEAVDDKTIQLDDRFAALCETREGLTTDINNLKAQVAAIDNECRAGLGTAEIGTAGKYKIMWVNQRVRRLDMDALKTAYPEIYEKLRKETLERRFLVKALKEAVSG